MAFFDWNHDGKKNYVDTAVEMMIIEDIEAAEIKNTKVTSYENYTPEWGAGYSGKKAYKRKMTPEEVDREFNKVIPFFWIIFGIAAAFILIINIISIFTGYVSWIGIVVSIVVLVLIRKSIKKHRNKFQRVEIKKE